MEKRRALSFRLRLIVVFSGFAVIALSLCVVGYIVLGVIADPTRGALEIENLISFMRMAMIGGGAGIIILWVIFYVRVPNSLSRHVEIIAKIVDHVSDTGSLEVPSELRKSTDDLLKRKDEFGKIGRSFFNMMTMLNSRAETLTQMANGNFTMNVDLVSPRDTIGSSLTTLLRNFNGLLFEINRASDQVASSSKQVSDESQILASGASEQSSTIDQFKISVDHVAETTAHNVGQTKEAADLSRVIMDNANKSCEQMEHMMQAVKEINGAGTAIGNVIKVIDDIAFQTNILALNAAVEASRAGVHGKGFSVVADEVRSLAAKSAEAANDTSNLIIDAAEKIKLGLVIAADTSSSLQSIVEDINKSAEIMEKIAQSSDDQLTAITQINSGIDQMAKVIQQNSETAQKSAASAEEMSGQSSVLDNLVSHFKLRTEF